MRAIHLEITSAGVAAFPTRLPLWYDTTDPAMAVLLDFVPSRLITYLDRSSRSNIADKSYRKMSVHCYHWKKSSANEPAA